MEVGACRKTRFEQEKARRKPGMRAVRDRFCRYEEETAVLGFCQRGRLRKLAKKVL